MAQRTVLSSVFASGMAEEADGAFNLAQRQLAERLRAVGEHEVIGIEHSTTSVIRTGAVLNTRTAEATPARASLLVVTLLASVRVAAPK